MFRLYSKGCEYALRALTGIPLDRVEDKISAIDLCAAAGIPEPFTRKALQVLSQTGFLKAVPGPGGGYRLTRHPKEITLLEIVLAVDGKDTFDGCLMGLAQCNDRKPCPVHETWKGVKGQLLKKLERKTLYELMKVQQLG
ncbi:MAG: Rrf2 family transcriptional regulator [Candidatus Omnitrophica bacterium]|nr:Rrf2 family transcriptional regulator [Candidatus Omnitrophota bacterium]